jgi:hypothetical protein
MLTLQRMLTLRLGLRDDENEVIGLADYFDL